MSEYITSVSKSDKNALVETDPNSFIFHSKYNSLKVVRTGVVDVVVPHNVDSYIVSEIHNLGFAPIVTAFYKETKRELISNSYVDVEYCVSAGTTNRVWVQSVETHFNLLKSVSADSTNVIFTLSNLTNFDIYIPIRYFCLD
jgi:hypothetical protein